MGQGCSSAASLFVVGIEPLLRALAAELAPSLHEVMSVFADDIAFSCRSTLRLLELEPLFSKFSLCATLDLGIPKCVVIPLASG